MTTILSKWAKGTNRESVIKHKGERFWVATDQVNSLVFRRPGNRSKPLILKVWTTGNSIIGVV